MEEIKLDVKTLDTPNLTVSEKNDSGTIKISGVPERADYNGTFDSWTEEQVK